MQWLNKIDDVLDYALGPSKSQNESAASNGETATDSPLEAPPVPGRGVKRIPRTIQKSTSASPNSTQSAPIPGRPRPGGAVRARTGSAVRATPGRAVPGRPTPGRGRPAPRSLGAAPLTTPGRLRRLPVADDDSSSSGSESSAPPIRHLKSLPVPKKTPVARRPGRVQPVVEPTPVQENEEEEEESAETHSSSDEAPIRQIKSLPVPKTTPIAKRAARKRPPTVESEVSSQNGEASSENGYGDVLHGERSALQKAVSTMSTEVPSDDVEGPLDRGIEPSPKQSVLKSLFGATPVKRQLSPPAPSPPASSTLAERRSTRRQSPTTLEPRVDYSNLGDVSDDSESAVAVSRSRRASSGSRDIFRRRSSGSDLSSREPPSGLAVGTLSEDSPMHVQKALFDEVSESENMGMEDVDLRDDEVSQTGAAEAKHEDSQSKDEGAFVMAGEGEGEEEGDVIKDLVTEMRPRRYASASPRRDSKRPSTASSTAGDRDFGRSDSMSETKSLPRHVEFRSEFDATDLRKSFRRSISVQQAEARFGNSMNRYGVFHVRLLRAQRLPCSVGSNVEAIVSLLPWQGKVRTQKTKSFSNESDRHGVCIRWDEDLPPCSMVHAYSGEETPIPSIKIDLVVKPFGMFEMIMCSLTILCEELLAEPSLPKRQWFAATVPDVNEMESSAGVPLMEVEAVFEPPEATSVSEHLDIEGRGESEDWQDSKGDGPPMDTIDTHSRHSDASVNLEEVTLPTPSARASLKTDERSHADGSLSLSNIRGQGMPIPAKPHMLRVTTHWTPAACCVCKRSIMTGLRRTKSYHCEVCNVDCCNDCRVQVDVQLPCGSEVAALAVADVVQNKLTVDNIMNTVAPVDESFRQEAEASQHLDHFEVGSLGRRVSTNLEPMGEKRGIGFMRFEFLKAHVLQDPLPPESSLEDLGDEKNIKVRKGDYYMRVSWTGGLDTKRTRTMQNTGRPKFDSGQLEFVVPHYGTEFRIELVDAGSDKPIGSALVTTQSMLQLQRDSYVKKYGIPFLALWRGPTSFSGAHRMVLELRTGVKSAYSVDFYNPSRGGSSEKDQPGAIIGSVELMAGMEEDLISLYGPSPYECPSRPADELNMAMFQVHIARLSNIITDLKSSFETYNYVVSWKNPFVTGLSLFLFVRVCIRFNPAYFGSLPLCFIILHMLYLGFARSQGRLKNKMVLKEVEDYRKAEKVSVDYSLHRPAGKVMVTVERGRNLRSPDLGLPGHVGCRVYWDPTRYLPEKKRKTVVDIDMATGARHEIGMTKFVYKTSPDWPGVVESEAAKRLKQLLPSAADGSFFGDSTSREESKGVELPILQPIKADDENGIKLQSWSKSPAAVVFEVKFQDTISLLPGSEYSLGEVAIPFSELSETSEISGWFEVLEVGTTRVVARGSDEAQGSFGGGHEEDDAPQIFLRVKWTPPERHDATETEREASIVIQEEMIRSAILSKERKLGLVGTSLGAFNTVRGLSDNLLLVQNTLGGVLDVVGSIRNAFNFSDPFKSTILLLVVVALWIFLICVPTKLIVLAAGIGQYLATFVSRFGRLFKRSIQKAPSRESSRSTDEETHPNPYLTWVMNAIHGLPTDEDLRKTYFWECRRLRAREVEEQTRAKRSARLSRLWRAQWYSTVEVLHSDKSSEAIRLGAFAMIQGHRFLWWPSVAEFDKGEQPIGRIFLAGHAGLATPSPIEMRSMRKEEISRATSIFGRGIDAQQKITIVACSEEDKDRLERAVVFAITSKKD